VIGRSSPSSELGRGIAESRIVRGVTHRLGPVVGPPPGRRVVSGLSTSETATARNGAIDGIKGLAILFVLLNHSLPDAVMTATYSLFHVSQAVPLLVVMMGYTGVMARIRPLGDYLKRRGVRLLVPWAIAWVVALVAVLIRGDRLWSPTLLMAALPGNGPGNYFIAIALQFVLLLPVLRWLLKKGPWVLLGTCLAFDISFQLLAGYVSMNEYVHKACILRYLFTLALGMLLVSGKRFWLLLPVSIAYLVLITQGFRIPLFMPDWQSQALFAAGYTVALVTIGLRLRYPRILEQLGRASWHIFLVQIIWFGQVAPVIERNVTMPVAALVLLNVAACIAVGMVFARVEPWLTEIVLARASRTAEGG
jgi:fucose 4-O-acetylase-like acetyltransferase